jgi:hypothetical protein
LIAYRTPAIDFLLEQEGLFRITTLVGGDEKTLNANMAMMYGLQDVRGYDSIIPRQYVEYMELIQPQGELPYNRIAPLSVKYPEALDSPLLDMLNARYVITVRERSIDRPGYTLVYDGEVRIYRNDDAMPRAFLVPRGENIPDAEARRQALRTLDPREVVILEETPRQAPAEVVPDTFTGAVQDIAYTPNEVTITVDTPIPCFLVLGDAFYDGWLAFMRPAEALQPELEEERLHIYRANGNFRAVEVPAGRHVVRFKYSPNPVKYGLYASFMSGMVLVLLGGCWAWRRFYREPRADADVQRVIKNTMAPMTLTLMNRVIDMAFAMLLLRILGPVDSGQYTLAVVIIAWFDILTNFRPQRPGDARGGQGQGTRRTATLSTRRWRAWGCAFASLARPGGLCRVSPAGRARLPAATVTGHPPVLGGPAAEQRLGERQRHLFGASSAWRSPRASSPR